MGGAYVAKPAVVTEPERPPGWDINWPFLLPDNGGWVVGPNPPGYTNSYSLYLTTPDSITPDEAAAITVIRRDYVDYPTAKPSTGTVLRWTAKKSGGDTVRLRFSGDEDYDLHLTSTYAQNAEYYWGATPSIEFDLDDDDLDDTLTLYVASRTSGGQDELTTQQDIEIAAGDFAVNASVVFTPTLASPAWVCSYRITYNYNYDVASNSAYFQTDEAPSYNGLPIQLSAHTGIMSQESAASGWSFRDEFSPSEYSSATIEFRGYAYGAFALTPLRMLITVTKGSQTILEYARSCAGGDKSLKVKISRATGLLVSETLS